MATTSTRPNLHKKLAWLISAREHKNFYSCRNQAGLLFQGSRAVQDPAVVDHIKEIFSQDLRTLGLNQRSNLSIFKEFMHRWIAQHTSSQLQGLDQYRIDFASGTTQSFDSFYYRHRQLRMRCFVGEYFYHLKTWTSNGTPWSFVTEHDPLVPGDALVVSLPFCDTGTVLPDLDSILDLCNSAGIPVLIDACYYPISGNISADLAHDCVDTVAFSLSKAFPIANLRIGIRYTKPNIFDGQALHDSINYNNTLGAYVGLELIKKFSCDYIYNTYKDRQQEVCEFFDLEPSDSVLFAIGDQRWKQYNRANLLDAYQLTLDADQFKNRISLVSIFDNWDLFEFIKYETTTKI
jgi:hypothetical protein